MSVDHSANIRTHPVDGEMHGDFARGVSLSAYLLPLGIHNNHVLGMQHTFAETRGRDHEPVAIHAHGEIAVGGRYKALCVEHSPELHQVLAKLRFVTGSFFEREHWVLPE